MTNDTTTISGALQEVIDQLETKLQNKGVNVSYDSTTGILGLIDEIDNIQTGSNDIVIDWNNINTAGSNVNVPMTQTITEIIIPNTVTSLGNDCFYNYKKLEKITIPSSVTSFGNYCFYGCTSLTDIIIPSSVTSFGTNCFYHCDSLTSINIPSNITSLPNNCFRYSGLTSISIPSSVTSLGTYCFSNCTSLTSITFEGSTPPTVSNSNAWTSLPTNCTIRVPSGSLNNYTSANNYPSSATYTYVEY